MMLAYSVGVGRHRGGRRRWADAPPTWRMSATAASMRSPLASASLCKRATAAGEESRATSRKPRATRGEVWVPMRVALPRHARVPVFEDQMV